MSESVRDTGLDEAQQIYREVFHGNAFLENYPKLPLLKGILVMECKRRLIALEPKEAMSPDIQDIIENFFYLSGPWQSLIRSTPSGNEGTLETTMKSRIGDQQYQTLMLELNENIISRSRHLPLVKEDDLRSFAQQERAALEAVMFPKK